MARRSNHAVTAIAEGLLRFPYEPVLHLHGMFSRQA
jgi:hypothetical protein